MYNPDYWCIIKIDSDDPHYRVFGSWSGSYIRGSSWRMNSGITKVEFDAENNGYLFYGASGSCYSCHKNMYGCHVLSQGELNHYTSDERFSIMPEETDWLTMDWIIK
jgi:hypothetical protein